MSFSYFYVWTKLAFLSWQTLQGWMSMRTDKPPRLVHLFTSTFLYQPFATCAWSMHTDKAPRLVQPFRKKHRTNQIAASLRLFPPIKCGGSKRPTLSALSTVKCAFLSSGQGNSTEVLTCTRSNEPWTHNFMTYLPIMCCVLESRFLLKVAIISFGTDNFCLEYSSLSYVFPSRLAA